jgi:transglutaminase-like putative cysteine protease
VSTLRDGDRLVARQGSSVGAATRRRFVLEQQIRYSYSGAITDLHQQLRVVPPARHGGQRRGEWSLRVDGVTSWSTRESVDSFGNLVLTLHVPRIDQAIDLAVHVEADTSRIAGSHSIPIDLRYSRPTPLTTADDAVTGLASPHIALDSKRADVEALCAAVHCSISYRWGVTGVHTTAAEALAGGVGVCQDYAHIMLAACRRAGWAARYVSGHLVGEGGSHAWVEVLRPSTTDPQAWSVEAWDPTHNRRVDDSYLVVAVGRDYRDAAPLSGTFEGSGVTGSLNVAKRLSA